MTLFMACALTGLGYYLSLLEPALTELEYKRSEETRLKQNLMPYKTKAGGIPHLEQQDRQLTAQLHKARHQLALYSDLPYLVSELARIGKQHQLELQLARTGEEIPDETFEIMTTELRLTGSYTAYLGFMEDISRLPYMTTLHDTQIQQKDNTLLIRVTLRTYLHKE
ncbi:MAG: type 4a pilus biogenesis protein PilO [Methylococcaceae bacterium]